MIRTEVYSREPGNHHLVWAGDLPAAPADDDAICLDEHDITGYVHDRTWILGVKPVLRLLVQFDPSITVPDWSDEPKEGEDG